MGVRSVSFLDTFYLTPCELCRRLHSDPMSTAKPAIPAPPSAVLRRVDYVAVVSLAGVVAEQPFDTFEEAHALVIEAKRRGADEAYVDERPLSAIGDDQ
jgi:hypothetical protein